MADEIIDCVADTKLVNKKKVTILRIKTHLIKKEDNSNENWSKENLQQLLTDMID